MSEQYGGPHASHAGGQPPPGGYPPQHGGWPPGHPQPPRPPRNGRLIALIVVGVVVASAMVGGIGAAMVLDDSDDDTSSAESIDADPTDAGPTDADPTDADPTESLPTDASPTDGGGVQPEPEPEPDVDSGQPGGALAEFEARLRQAGWQCYLTWTKPVILRSCYREPGLGYSTTAQVRNVLNEQGEVQRLLLDVHNVGHGQVVTRTINTVFNALRGSLLTPTDIRKLQARQKAPRLELSWGVAANIRTGADYRSVIVTRPEYAAPAIGTDVPWMGRDATQISPNAMRTELRRHGFRCVVDKDFSALECRKRRGSETYAVTVSALQGLDGDSYTRKSREVTAYWGLDQFKDTDAQVGRTVNQLFYPIASLALGTSDPAVKRWIGRRIDGKFREGDLHNLHVEIEPDSAFTGRTYEVSVTIGLVNYY